MAGDSLGGRLIEDFDVLQTKGRSMLRLLSVTVVLLVVWSGSLLAGRDWKSAVYLEKQLD